LGAAILAKLDLTEPRASDDATITNASSHFPAVVARDSSGGRGRGAAKLAKPPLLAL
jgi:hypothetical protein